MSWLTAALGAVTGVSQATKAVAQVLDEQPEVELSEYQREIAEGYVRARQEAVALYAKSHQVRRRVRADRLARRAGLKEAEAEGYYGALLRLGVAPEFIARLERRALPGVQA